MKVHVAAHLAHIAISPPRGPVGYWGGAMAWLKGLQQIHNLGGLHEVQEAGLPSRQSAVLAWCTGGSLWALKVTGTWQLMQAAVGQRLPCKHQKPGLVAPRTGPFYCSGLNLGKPGPS